MGEPRERFARQQGGSRGKHIKRFSIIDAEFEDEYLHLSKTKLKIESITPNEILLNYAAHHYYEYPPIYGKKYVLREL